MPVAHETRPEDFVLGDAFARILTETTQSLVCVLDAHGRIVLFNDACERATGFTRDEVLGRDACECVIPPEEHEGFREVLAYIWRTGLTSPQVGHWLTKDGGRRLIAWSNKPLVGDDGTFLYLVTAGVDLTERARSDEQNERALEGDPDAKLAQIGQLAQEQRALRRVATLVASEARPDRVFHAVSEECARVLHVNASAVFRFEGDDTATIVGRHNRDSIDTFALGDRVSATEETSIGRVLRSGEPARTDDWSDLQGEVADAVVQSGYRSTASAPITVAGITGAPSPSRARTRSHRTRRSAWPPSASSCHWRSRAPRRGRICARRARASSRPATSSAASSSETSTTARSSGSSRSR